MRRLCIAAAFAVAVAVCVTGCGGSGKETLTLKQRLLPASTFEGYDVVRTFDWRDANGPAEEGFGLVRATPSQAASELDAQGFVDGVGELLQNAGQEHYPVIVLRFHTEKQAEAVQSWEHHDLLLPCRHTCNTRISEFTVDGIPGSEGVNRVVGVPTPGGATVDRWVISFVKGPVLYIVERSGDVGMLKNGHNEAVEAANDEYDRVKNASFPSSS
jgi:hypothetical protein